MMAPFAERGVTVNHLRVRCSLDPVTARLRTGRLLDESALHPAMPPAAILCIRRLADPRPGAIGLDGVQLPSPAWNAAVAATVTDLARRARRPGLGDAAGADAVIFADRAELLACLAADWCAGRIAALWWWRALLKDIGDARAVLRAWLDTPASIAAALEDLAGRGLAATFVGRLSAPDTRALIDAIVVHHDLPRLARILEGRTPAGDGVTHRSARTRTVAAAAPSDEDSRAIDDVRQAPWTSWVAAIQPRQLRVDQECVLGIALTIRRAPTLVRTARFAADVERWLDAADADVSTTLTNLDARSSRSGDDRNADATRIAPAPSTHARVPVHADTGDRVLASIPSQASIDARPSHAIDSPHQTVRVHADRVEPARRPSADVAAAPERDRRSAPATDRGSHTVARRAGAIVWLDRRDTENRSVARREEPTRERQTALGVASVSATQAAAPAAAVSGSASLPADRTDTHSWLDTPSETTERDAGPAALAQLRPATATAPFRPIDPAPVETEIGGVFYLINLALALGLYGDFTTPAQRGLDLSVWDFLTLVGRRLTPRQFRSDPLWTLLADLAGRAPDERPGAAFEAPGRWCVPAAWLTAFPDEGAWRYFETTERLRAVHPAGFVVVDVPRRPSRKTPTATFARARWLRWLMPYVRARLARAMGGDGPWRAAARLCLQPARIVPSATRVDVTFPLAALPIEVRLSGLDRNPGWVPAADRVIAYHFE